MSAVCKTLDVRSNKVKSLLEYCKNPDKTSCYRNGYANDCFGSIVDGQFRSDILVTGVKCDKDTAALQFRAAQDDYRYYHGTNEQHQPFEYTDKKTGETRTVVKKPVAAVHLIQSFNNRNIDPHLVHDIGVELVRRLGVQAVVCTHMNEPCLHNHIVINSYTSEHSKWACNLEERRRLRKLSDDIQREFGLRVTHKDPTKIPKKKSKKK